ncbi:DNA-deoxyinosine glycosylase [Mycolicibacterium vaccae]|uniref:DNA-deoxyinosine glycosylase n=1 Tax=Mycolicibacterium vaccae TaxID=1810 RepID=UPI003D03FA86
MTSPTVHSFPPIVAPGARLLILGNMPGVASLTAQRYYAYRQNAFWRITGALFGFDPEAPYDERIAALADAGVAVWDVLRSCRRPGSLDSKVEPASMVANDFTSLFATYPKITHVYFNGAAAEKNYHRLVTVDHPLKYHRLPSTSPAQTMRFEDKLAAWSTITDASRTSRRTSPVFPPAGS